MGLQASETDGGIEFLIFLHFIHAAGLRLGGLHVFRRWEWRVDVQIQAAVTPDGSRLGTECMGASGRDV